MQICPVCKKEFDEAYGTCPHCGHIVGTSAGVENRPAPKKAGRIILAAVLVLLAVGIAAFAAHKIWNAKTSEPTGSQTVTAPEPGESAAQPNTEWIAAYKSYLLDRIEEILKESDTDEANLYQSFALIYFDDDDVPELVVSEGDFHPSTASLVTLCDGEVRTFPGLGSFGSFSYKEKQGVLVEGYSGSGVSSSNVWRLEQGNLTCVWSGEEDFWDEEGPNFYVFDADVMNEYRQTENEAYYEKWDATRKEISKAEFNAQYNEIVPTGLTASPVNSATAPRMTRQNVETYFAALADTSDLTRIRTFTEVTLSGTASEEIQTDFRGNTYQDFVLDEPIVVQFEDDVFPALLTSVCIASYDMASVPSGHTTITTDMYKDSDGFVWCSAA